MGKQKAKGKRGLASVDVKALVAERDRLAGEVGRLTAMLKKVGLAEDLTRPDAWVPPTIRDPKKRAFLAALPRVLTVTHACDAAGISRAIHYQWLKEDKEYAAAVLEADQVANDSIEYEVKRRGFIGSDILLIFLAKARMPEKYRDRVSADISGKVTLETLVAGSWDQPAALPGGGAQEVIPAPEKTA